MLSRREAQVLSHPSLYGDDDEPLLQQKTDTRSMQPERPKGFGSRHTLTLWAFLGFINVYAMRVNLSVALVAMVNSSDTAHNVSPHHRNITPGLEAAAPLPFAIPSSLVLQEHLLQMHHDRGGGGDSGGSDNTGIYRFRIGDNSSGTTDSGEYNHYYSYLGRGPGVLEKGIDAENCPDPPGWGNSSSEKQGEFNWNEETQGYILGAFFYGYLVSQVPGGWLATRFGGKKVFGLGVLCTSVLTLLTPLAARSSIYLFIALRALEGLGEGVTFPAMHAMFGVWAPLFERSNLVVFAYAGADLGTVISMPISGLLCDSDIAGGWPSVFYIFGALGVLWTIGWMIFVHDSPASHPWISEEEKAYIEVSIGKSVSSGRPPWSKILTSSALWGIVCGHLANNWGVYVFLTCLPTYMKQILKFNMKTDASLSAVPYALSWVVKLLSSVSADLIRKNGYLSTKNTRKLFNSIGSFLPAAMVLVVGFVGCNHVTAVLSLTLCMGFSGFAAAGYGVNHLDIAPRYSGILLGITNSFGTMPGFLSPLLVGELTNNNETRGQWMIVFYITAAIYVLGAILYLILAQGEELPWGGLSSSPAVVSPGPLTVNDSEYVQTETDKFPDLFYTSRPTRFPSN